MGLSLGRPRGPSKLMSNRQIVGKCVARKLLVSDCMAKVQPGKLEPSSDS